MLSGPRGPLLSSVSSMLVSLSRFMVSVRLRSLHSLSTTASSAVSLTSLCVQLAAPVSLSRRCASSITLSVQTVMLMPARLAPRPVPSSTSIFQRPFSPPGMP